MWIMANFKMRKPIFDKIAKERKSMVVSYMTGDRRQLETQISPEVIDIFVEHLDAIGPTKTNLSIAAHQRWRYGCCVAID